MLLFREFISGLLTSFRNKCKDVFLHSGRRRETFRVWRLIQSQVDGLLDFLLERAPMDGFSLPVQSSEENRYRWDPWDAIALHHIFRDPWERRIPLQKPTERDVKSVGDYPEMRTLFNQVEETTERANTLGEEASIHYEDNCDSAKDTYVQDRTGLPGKPDRLWIFRHGGCVGEPLGSRRLPLIGPPDGRGMIESCPYDDSGDDEDDRSEDSFGQGFRTPSPSVDDVEAARPHEESLRRDAPTSQTGKTCHHDNDATSLD